MVNILVTGGAGYIGSHCVKQLLSQGHHVVVLDNLSTGYRGLVLTEHFVHGSTLDRSLVTRTLQEYGIETVMHFAASCYVGESVHTPEKYYENNVNGTLQLLLAMQEAGIQQFIFSSTCAVYGEPETQPITEAAPFQPVSPYGFTKRVIEEMLKDFSRNGPLRYISLRYFNAAGADPDGRLGECHVPESHLIPLVLQAASGERPNITLFGTDYDTRDGTCVRDYIHILDLAQAHLLAMAYLRQGGASDFFNLGSEEGYTVREVIAACEQVTNKTVPILEGERRPGDPPTLVAGAGKIKQKLGWKPTFKTLEEMIETAWLWESRKTEVLGRPVH